MEFALKRYFAITLWIIVPVNLQVATASPMVVLSSSLPEGQEVCPGDEIIFTCVTNGSASLAWSSDDYIGRGGIQLEFASFDSPGKIARNRLSPIGTKASLINKEIEENETQIILESQLNVIVTSDYPNPTIKCLSVDTGIQETTSFQLLGEPDAPKEVKAIEIRDNRNVEGSCVFTLRLSPPGNIDPDDTMYYIGYQSQRDVVSSTSHTFIVLNCTPNLRINVTAVNRCGSIGRSVIDVMPIFLSDTEGVAETSNGVNIGLTVVLPVILPVVVVVVILIAIVLTITLILKKRKGSSDALQGPPYPMSDMTDGPDRDQESILEKSRQLEKVVRRLCTINGIRYEELINEENRSNNN